MLPARPVLIGVGVVAVVTAVVVAVLVLTGDDDASVGPDPERVAELEAERAERDAAQVAELTELARTIHAELVPVLEEMNETLPADGADTAAVTGAQVASWRDATDSAVASFADPPSGSTGHNVARGGLRVAVELLASTVTAVELAREADDDGRAALESQAAELRKQAVRAWAVAATQLDMVNIEAGHGHVHLFLPANPDDGAMTADSMPEGSEAHDHNDDHD